MRLSGQALPDSSGEVAGEFEKGRVKSEGLAVAALGLIGPRLPEEFPADGTVDYGLMQGHGYDLIELNPDVAVCLIVIGGQS